MIEQGEIYIADLNVAGRRPALVVSRDSLNRGDYAMVVTFTTRRLDERKRLANCVFFRAGEFGLKADCVAQCETLTTVEHFQLDAKPIGRLDEPTMHSVIRAIGYVIEADCQPD